MGEESTAPDQDYFRISLVAGQNYTFDVIGGTLTDPTLGVRDGNNNALLAFNNTGSLNSHISFTPQHSGTYYLDVGGFGANTGSYTLFA